MRPELGGGTCERFVVLKHVASAIVHAVESPELLLMEAPMQLKQALANFTTFNSQTVDDLRHDSRTCVPQKCSGKRAQANLVDHVDDRFYYA